MLKEGLDAVIVVVIDEARFSATMKLALSNARALRARKNLLSIFAVEGRTSSLQRGDDVEQRRDDDNVLEQRRTALLACDCRIF